MKQKIIGMVVLVCLSGCTYTRYTNGATSFTRVSVGTQSAIGPIALKAGENSLSVGGIMSDQGAAVEAAKLLVK